MGSTEVAGKWGLEGYWRAKYCGTWLARGVMGVGEVYVTGAGKRGNGLEMLWGWYSGNFLGDKRGNG